MSNAIYMSSPINALIEGLYEARTTIADLKQRGDFGIGTFNDLDGELVMIDGIVYQQTSDGRCQVIPDDVCTPFAAVCFFHQHTEDTIGPVDYAEFNQVLAANRPSPNMFYALRIDGEFEFVRTRAVPKTENYTPLVEAVSRQQEHRFTAIRGSLIGFYTPPFMPSVNVPGLHFHFISDDRTSGGHLLECALRKGCVAMQFFYEMTLSLPKTLDYLSVDFTRDSAHDLERAEK